MAESPVFSLRSSTRNATLSPGDSSTSSACQKVDVNVFPLVDPRLTNLVLGMVIGLSMALAWHLVAWALHA